MDDPVVVAQDVRRVYGVGGRSVVAVEGATFSVPPGRRIAIVGPSGSGKSTLLHLMAGIDLPTSGVMSWPAIGGRDTLRPGPLAVAFQGPSLLPALTVTENVALPLLLEGHDETSALAAAMTCLDLFDLGEVADKLPEEISGGQSQQAGLARALVSGPRLVLVDEPTGQLDRETAARTMLALLDAIVASRCRARRRDPRPRGRRTDGRLLADGLRRPTDQGDPMLGVRWVAGLVRRRPGRIVGLTIAVAMAVLLTASLGAFFSASRSRMTADAVASVPVDWQVQLTPGTDVAKATSTVAATRGILQVLPVGYAIRGAFDLRSEERCGRPARGWLSGSPRAMRPRSPARSGH